MKEVVEALNSLIKNCKNCKLNDGYHLSVPGMWVGPSSEVPDLFILAEAPGEEESDPRYHLPNALHGKPLTGKAGRALSNQMIDIGYKQNNISMFITNTVKHRPPQNRPPTSEEKLICSKYLLTQILIYKPKIILALGKHASETLRTLTGQTSLDVKESHYRKDFIFKHDKIPYDTQVISTYHPSYALLRNPDKAKDLRKDLEQVLNLILKTK